MNLVPQLVLWSVLIGIVLGAYALLFVAKRRAVFVGVWIFLLLVTTASTVQNFNLSKEGGGIMGMISIFILFILLAEYIFEERQAAKTVQAAAKP